MLTQTVDIVVPTDYSTEIFEASGIKFDEVIAADLWQKIMDHKWILSEKLGRDVGFRAACIDYLDNFEVGKDLRLGRQAEEIMLKHPEVVATARRTAGRMTSTTGTS
jgi:hypothetical protein